MGQPPGVCSLWFSTQKAAPYSSRPSPQRLGALGARARVGVVRVCVLSMPRRFPRVIAEKNLLKIHLSNWYVRLNVVNNRSGHIFLQANTMEKVLQQRLLGQKSLNDRKACEATAELLCERARRQNVTQLTFERQRLKYMGRVKVIIDTLRENGIEFMSHVSARPPRPASPVVSAACSWVSELEESVAKEAATK